MSGEVDVFNEDGPEIGRSRHRAPAPTLDLGLIDDVPFTPDPLDPHPEHPTPLDLVLQLSASERETRVKRLVEMAWNRYDEAVDVHSRQLGTEIVATCSLVSGGNDSYTVAHIFREVATHQVHANTGTGIEATREFVRATAAEWGVPLIEKHVPEGQGYFDLVRGNVMAVSRKTGQLVQSWPGGFPGPAAHRIMYQRLKGRGLEKIPHDFGISGSTTERVLFIAGRRRPESKRRATVPHHERQGTIVWASPLAVWHKADLRTYRLMMARTDNPVPVNPVSKVLGMSGECGCLANAVAEEADKWKAAYPDDPFIRKVIEVEAELVDRDDIPEHRKRWGWGGTFEDPDEVQSLEGTLCSVNCGVDPLFDLMDPLFLLEQEELGLGGAA